MTIFRRLAWLTVFATFLLIVVGAVVRVTGSGLGCPDWPTCHGQLIPPWILQPLIEFSHRFTAALVSVLIVAMAGYALSRFRTRRGIVVPAVLAFLLLIVQIGLGAVTVITELEPVLVTSHLATALAIIAMAAIAATVASTDGETDRRFTRDGYAGLALLTLVLTYALLLAGAYVIATASSFACDNWPLCGNGLQAPAAPDATINFIHRLAAGLVAVIYVVLALRGPAARPKDPALRRYLNAGLVLLAAQVAVGAGVVLWRVPPFTAALHLAVAAAFWANLVVIAVRACTPHQRGSVLPSQSLRSATSRPAVNPSR